MEGPEIALTDNETIEVTDEYVSVADGRATKLKRTFDKLTGDSTENVSMSASGGEDQEKAAKKESPLERKSVVFTWKDDAYAAAWAEGEKGDDDLLEKLDADMDLIGLLPTKSVSDGDNWVLAPQLFNKISSPGGRLHLKDKSEADKEDKNAVQDVIEKNIEGEAKATYKGTREVDGVKMGVLEITAELEARGTAEEGKGENAIEYKVKYDGEALWDIKSGHLHSLKLTGKMKISMDTKTSIEFNGESHEMHQKIEFSGDVEHTISVE